VFFGVIVQLSFRQEERWLAKGKWQMEEDEKMLSLQSSCYTTGPGWKKLMMMIMNDA